MCYWIQLQALGHSQMYLTVIITQSWAVNAGGSRRNLDADFHFYGLGSPWIVILLLTSLPAQAVPAVDRGKPGALLGGDGSRLTP